MTLTVRNNTDWPLAFPTLQRAPDADNPWPRGLELEPGETADILDPPENSDAPAALDIVSGTWPDYTPEVKALLAARAGEPEPEPAAPVANAPAAPTAPAPVDPDPEVDDPAE